ncbi:PIN-like domain-containing protein [Mycobacteroides abscessus]|uniref:PIN like domain-containing protein n=1 Tax=Mycobacteroides abscessus TaxID=36809 RepID=A0ABD7HJ31_9MYCO|nr:PIN domain-containing protein [Mycobacteroides abscessus]PVA77454.1 hypothetical protein DDJ37_01855 [Mycobacteroides abscessus]PVB18921.1 hypothetical protein DDJ40_03570 [Mycobacteroides abscessus]PVB23655.1 hypothetical protein DDJ71_01700 [Mycobacteroides abscessus]RIR48339.1 hypothetical protein D2E39_09970 [Mycobacteroides abscessus]RIR63384.1 hypothetical protein D2E62_17315 [Mycobacteroides abscessus]
MRDAFREWYQPDDNDVEQIVATGTIALDANVLLDLYRVGARRREEIFGAFRAIGDRLWVPYQAVLEYHTNRLKVIADTQTHFDKVFTEVEAAAAKALSSALKSIRDPAVRKQIQETFDVNMRRLESAHSALKDSHVLDLSQTRTGDPVRAALEIILTGDRLGKRPTDTELAERRQEAGKRINDKRPPGFQDADNKTDPCGDYLVWSELLAHARSADRSILFVTNDSKKDDWFLVLNGMTMGPLPTLVAEMAAASPNHAYHQVSLDGLLALANKYLGATVTDETIQTVRDVTLERQRNEIRVRIKRRAANEAYARDGRKRRTFFEHKYAPLLSELMEGSPRLQKDVLDILQTSHTSEEAEEQLTQLLYSIISSPSTGDSSLKFLRNRFSHSELDDLLRHAQDIESLDPRSRQNLPDVHASHSQGEHVVADELTEPDPNKNQPLESRDN